MPAICAACLTRPFVFFNTIGVPQFYRKIFTLSVNMLLDILAQSYKAQMFNPVIYMFFCPTPLTTSFNISRF